MRAINNVKIDLSNEEHRRLLDAQKVWQSIYSMFDENGIDVAYITDVLDKELSDLLDACQYGVRLELDWSEEE